MTNQPTQEDLECACKLARSLYEPMPPSSWYPKTFCKPLIVDLRPKPKPLVNGIHLNGEGLEGVKRDAFFLACEESEGSPNKIARKLKVSRSQVWLMAKKYLRTGISVLLLTLTGCVSTQPTLSTPPVEHETEWPLMTPPAPLPSAFVFRPSFVLPPPPIISLAWDNPNPLSEQPYLLTEFHSTTNLMSPFRFKAYVPPLTNGWTFPTSLPQEYFICRFVRTNVQPWLVSDWNQKTP